MVVVGEVQILSCAEVLMETSLTAPTPRKLRSCAPMQYLWCCAFWISLSPVACWVCGVGCGLPRTVALYTRTKLISLCTHFHVLLQSESGCSLSCVWIHLLNTLLESRETRVWICQPQRLYIWKSDTKFNNELVCIIAPCSYTLLGGTWVAECMNNLEIALVFFSVYWNAPSFGLF